MWEFNTFQAGIKYDILNIIDHNKVQRGTVMNQTRLSLNVKATENYTIQKCLNLLI